MFMAIPGTFFLFFGIGVLLGVAKGGWAKSCEGCKAE